MYIVLLQSAKESTIDACLQIKTKQKKQSRVHLFIIYLFWKYWRSQLCLWNFKFLFGILLRTSIYGKLITLYCLYLDKKNIDKHWFLFTLVRMAYQIYGSFFSNLSYDTTKCNITLLFILKAKTTNKDNKIAVFWTPVNLTKHHISFLDIRFLVIRMTKQRIVSVLNIFKQIYNVPFPPLEFANSYVWDVIHRKR